MKSHRLPHGPLSRSPFAHRSLANDTEDNLHTRNSDCSRLPTTPLVWPVTFCVILAKKMGLYFPADTVAAEMSRFTSSGHHHHPCRPAFFWPKRNEQAWRTTGCLGCGLVWVGGFNRPPLVPTSRAQLAIAPWGAKPIGTRPLAPIRSFFSFLSPPPHPLAPPDQCAPTALRRTSGGAPTPPTTLPYTSRAQITALRPVQVPFRWPITASLT
jgi:hypothetical protein